jgi:hypothetical protein
VYVATPEPFSVPVPSVVAPSLNVTVPVGVLELLVVTVAVKVTEEPAGSGFALDANAVVVVPWLELMVWVSALDVLPALFASPP